MHTRTIDGYWGLLKRGVIGSFHQISGKHLHRYLAELQFKRRRCQYLCDELTATETIFPGTDLRLVYKLGSS